MTTRTWQAGCNNAPNLGGLFLFVILFAAAAGTLILGSHATKHSMADVVRNCPDDKIGLILLNPMTGRRAILCEYSPDQWGRIIEEDGKEVTSYADSSNPLENMLQTVIKRLYRGGYNHVQFIKNDLITKVAEILGALR